MIFRRSRRQSAAILTSRFPPPYMSPTRSNGDNPIRPTLPQDSEETPSHPGLQPYLGLRARTSLAWLAYPILILVLILVQLILSLQSVHDGVGDAKRELQSACAGIEGAASVAVSIPHFMADQTNNFLVSGAEDIVHGLAVVLDLAIRAIEAIILYVIDTYRSLYLCLAEFVVRGSLALLIAAAQEAEKVFQEATAGVRTAIQATIGGAESLFNGAINDLNKLPGVNIKPPTLTVPNLDALQNAKLPTGFSDALTKLNSSLPTLAELRDSLDKLITVPFEEMRVDVTTKLKAARIDRSLLKVPPRKSIYFCQDLNTSFIDEVGKVITFGIKFIIGAVVAAIVAIALFNIIKERFLFKRLLVHLKRSRETWLNQNVNKSLSNHNLLAFLHSVNSPFSSRVTNGLMNKRNKASSSSSSKNRMFWLTAYLTWPSALLFLGAGLLGLTAVELQLLSLNKVRNRAVHEANNGVDGLSNLLINKINSETLDVSQTFANDTNSVLSSFESGVNNNMLGWAGTTTTTLNNTLTTFYDGLTNAVSTTFGNTPLKDPSLELLNCLIGSKVAGIQAALTFVHDHAHVDLPRVSPTALMVTPRQTEDLVGAIAAPQQSDGSRNLAAAGPQENNTTATRFVDRLIDRYVRALKKQRVTYLALLACYLIVIIFAIVAIIWDIIQIRKNKPREGTIEPFSSPPSPQIQVPSKEEKTLTTLHNVDRGGERTDPTTGGLKFPTNGSKFREVSKDYYYDKDGNEFTFISPRASNPFVDPQAPPLPPQGPLPPPSLNQQNSSFPSTWDSNRSFDIPERSISSLESIINAKTPKNDKRKAVINDSKNDDKNSFLNFNKDKNDPFEPFEIPINFEKNDDNVKDNFDIKNPNPFETSPNSNKTTHAL